MKIDFEHFKMYTDVAHKNTLMQDVREQFANTVYQTVQGVAGLSLSMKIYKSSGETEYDDTEMNLVKQTAENYTAAMFISSLNEIINNQK